MWFHKLDIGSVKRFKLECTAPNAPHAATKDSFILERAKNIFSFFTFLDRKKIKHKLNHFQIKTSRWSICKSCIGGKIWLILLRRIKSSPFSHQYKVEFSKQFITLNTFYALLRTAGYNIGHNVELSSNLGFL